jgi:formiminoglutamase
MPDLPRDPLWPRAAHWIAPAPADDVGRPDIAILGVPAYKSSITATGAHATPAAVRDALLRYSPWAGSRNVDLSPLTAVDLGDVEDPDGPAGEARTGAAIARVRDARLVIALGGDNSITYAVVRALFDGNLSGCGLITVDAHHDVRDGETNGSPVRRLIAAGLPGDAVVQIGIADFSNSRDYSARAAELGITVIARRELHRTSLDVACARALHVAGRNGRPVFVDIDVDVCDRAAVPACPSAAPGGISAEDLREIAFLLALDPRVRGLDITEIDATADAPDQRTVRLAALLVLEAAAGIGMR